MVRAAQLFFSHQNIGLPSLIQALPNRSEGWVKWKGGLVGGARGTVGAEEVQSIVSLQRGEL